MTLKDWLEQDGRTQAWIVRHTGTSRSVVHDWVHGRKIPTPDKQAMIELLSGGAVGPADWALARHLKAAAR